MNTNFNLTDPTLMFAAGGAPEAEFTTGFAPDSRLYPNLPADEYHADREALSCSMLKPMLISPAHFQADLLAQQNQTKAKDFGSLVHALVLEPHLAGKDFAVFPGFADGRNAEYKEFLASNTGRLVVDEPTFARGRRLAEKILHREVYGRPFGDYVAEGIPEASIYFEEPTTGLKLRVRLDLYHPEYSFDLKSTRHATMNAFIRDSLDMHYDLQAFMYTFGRTMYDGSASPKPFVFIAAESEEPHSVHVVRAGDSYLSNGAKKFQEVLSLYWACTKAGLWPDASGEDVAEITPWQSFSGNADLRKALH